MDEEQDRAGMGDGPRPYFATRSSTQCNEKDRTVPCEDVSNMPAETVNGRWRDTIWNAQKGSISIDIILSDTIFPVTGMTFLLVESAPLCRRRW